MELRIKTTIVYQSLTLMLIIVGATSIFYLNHYLYNKHKFSKLNKNTFEKISHVKSGNTSLQNRSGGFKMNLYDVQTCFNLKPCRKEQNLNYCPLKPNMEGTFECSHFMTFPTLPGRTGNQLFQVAVLLGTAMYHGYTPLIDPSLHLKEYFDLPNVQHFSLVNNHNITTKGYFQFDNRIFELSHDYNWTLRGYIFSWKYFEGASMAIRKALTFKKDMVAKANKFIKQTLSEKTTKVCVHVRRGDYLQEYEAKRGRTVAPVRYYKDAMERFKQNFTRVHYFILSDDKKWCKENLNGENVTFSSFDSAGLDLALMSLCDHTIITAGTFGWWGAWLSGGDVIYWTGYPRKGSTLDKMMVKRDDFFPRKWTGLP